MNEIDKAVEEFVNEVANTAIEFEQNGQPNYYGQVTGLNGLLTRRLRKTLTEIREEAVRETEDRCEDRIKKEVAEQVRRKKVHGEKMYEKGKLSNAS